ncbi:MAG: tetraacyldisaccharide 4'-kinase [Acidobacteriaceae bacterium]
MSRHPGVLLRHAVSPLLWPLALVYAMGVRLKNCAFDRFWVQSQKLSWPVISVGNLSVGGTGKTPLVLLLADRLTQRGWTVDVLSRGHGRSSREVTRVNPLGTAEEFGDEPLLMSRHGLSVYVGANRFDPGQLAEACAKADSVPSEKLHLLDDGFQHRRLARAIDIVLVQRADLGGNLLPVGRLREPPSALRRADICVLRAEDADLSGRVLQSMRRPGNNPDPARLWIVERRTALPSAPSSIPNALVFCAIGDAKGFFDGLRQAGMTLQAAIAFLDHHVYSANDIEGLKAAARRCGAKCFVTTEKDSVRLAGTLRAELEKEGPLIVAELDVSLHDERRCIDSLEALLKERLQLRPRNVR